MNEWCDNEDDVLQLFQGWRCLTEPSKMETEMKGENKKNFFQLKIKFAITNYGTESICSVQAYSGQPGC